MVIQSPQAFERHPSGIGQESHPKTIISYLFAAKPAMISAANRRPSHGSSVRVLHFSVPDSIAPLPAAPGSIVPARHAFVYPGEPMIREPLEDVTAQKRAEEKLVKAGALQNAIFNSANFSSIATDEKGVIQIFNVGAERMLGYAAAEVMNKITPADISDPQEVITRAKALSTELGTTITPGFEALVFKASRGIEDIYELTYIRKDGSRFPAIVSVTALRDAQGGIIGYLLIGTDNTARKLAEEALVKAGALQNAILNSAN